MGNSSSREAPDGSYICPSENDTGKHPQPLFGTMSFTTFSRILTGAFAGVVTLIMTALILSHAFQYSRPAEQKHVMRASTLVSTVALLSFGCTFFNNHDAQYLQVIIDLWESFAFGSFFIMYCNWLSRIAPRSNTEMETIRKDRRGELFGDNIHQISAVSADIQPDKKELFKTSLLDGIRCWLHYQRIPFFVFQFPAVMIVLTIVTEATNAAGVYCIVSSNVHFAHLWITIIKSVSTFVCFFAVLRTYRKTRHLIAYQRPGLKMFSFKSIIALLFLQTLIFSFGTSSGSFTPTSVLSYNDIAVSIPAIISSGEMLFFAVLFLYAYRASQYKLSSGPAAANNGPAGAAGDAGQEGQNYAHPADPTNPHFSSVERYQGGTLGVGAIFDMVNITDLFKAMVLAPGRFLQSRRGGEGFVAPWDVARS